MSAQFLLLIAGSAIAAALTGCALPSSSSISDSYGPQPNLPEPTTSLLPTVNIAPAKGWPAGAMPTPAAGLKVQAFARGLEHPRWLHVLPNGDVLVAVGNGLNTPEAVAGLFGTGLAAAPFAQPSVAAKSAPAKAVLITADIVGDARIWYVVNQTGTSVIDNTEVTLVGLLKDVNNLALTGYGFVAANFA